MKRKKIKRLEKIWEAASDYLMAENNKGFADHHGGIVFLKQLWRDAINDHEERK
jgi:hypothetical protein